MRGKGAGKVAWFAMLLQETRLEFEAGARRGAAGTRWGHRLARLRRAVEEGGTAAAGAPRPRRDLRAVRGGARAEEQRGHTSVVNFLAALSAQQIPADTLAEEGVRATRSGC